MISTILFDLDGTLLPMDMDVFTNAYFKRLVQKLLPHGYDSEALVKGVWAGTAAMVKNNGEQTNEEAFWIKFAEIFGDKVYQDKPLFDEYYRVEFQDVKSSCGFTAKSKEITDYVKSKGYRVILATNPIFPAVATESRIRWAGLDPANFEYYTTYENSVHCKPNPGYYSDIIKALDLNPQECLMVGNDVDEDMVAEETGMKVFLLTDCILNKHNKDIGEYPNGGFDELRRYIDSL